MGPIKSWGIFPVWYARNAEQSYVKSTERLMLNGRGALKPFPQPGTVGELTAINNIGRTRRWARSKKTALIGKCPNYFCPRQ